jgi:hypothetical protein
MNRRESVLSVDKRKLLSFTDNRQDAALQAGHFNDFLFVSLLRAALLSAAVKAGPEGLSEEEFGRKVQAALGFTAAQRERRSEWMMDPTIKGPRQIEAEGTLARVLTYRVWSDQRRGWRFTNPSLEDLGLLRVEYLSLEELANDDEAFVDAPDVLRRADATVRNKALRILLDAMRQGLAITTESLESFNVEATANLSRQSLRDPWSISQQEQETLRIVASLVIDPPKKADTGLRGEALIVRAGPRSGLARRLGHRRLWGMRMKGSAYEELLRALLAAAASYELVRPVSTPFEVQGWRLAANAVRLVAADARSNEPAVNSFFVDLYLRLAEALDTGGEGLFGLEGRAHTAQVEQRQRQWREWRFRWGTEDQRRISEAKAEMRSAEESESFLPVLFCSPTMELGVDISSLNAVYLRNVPPTPANYTQRSGRAGPSGQAALVVTYCAAQSPHDQYYFRKPELMVHGYVRPPAIEIANRDLIEAHLHAVWLAETKKALPDDIPHILDLKQDDLPIFSEIVDAFEAPDVRSRAIASMERILDSVASDFTPASAPWAHDRGAFATMTAERALHRFSRAFNRWRQLYKSAHMQLREANRQSEAHGIPAVERRKAKDRHRQASDQIDLLERGTSTGNSDFSTYRYLATEGFLPGYNFPRLPLYAFIPAVGGGGSKAAYLQRARFVAIAEFGPHSLIYHEGRAFRVYKAKLPPEVRNREGGQLAVTRIFICNACGAGHEKEEPERCHACDAPMDAFEMIGNLLRIDNVETRSAERITANDEDRQRQGFEIQTTFAWPRREGIVDVSSARACDVEGPILHLDYGSGATISRLNKGLRRRKAKTVFGFGIDPGTGAWARGEIDDEQPEMPDEPGKQRVVPIVQDNKNAALLRLSDGPLNECGMATLQHAFTRGIELVFQLEGGETLTEPLPTSDRRKAILAFEATEGGAGVLGRLLAEPHELAKVAKATLELMHYQNIDQAVMTADPSELIDEPDADCVRACYRCILSYYNQPDHERIDRRDIAFLRVLLRLARATVQPIGNLASPEISPLHDSWGEVFAAWSLPRPRGGALEFAGVSASFVWPEHRVVAHAGAVSEEMRSDADSRGYLLIELPKSVEGSAPRDLAEALSVSG